ncbi:MAG: glycosyltransferase family 39 protein [Verrucomicrobiota bacterium]
MKDLADSAGDKHAVLARRADLLLSLALALVAVAVVFLGSLEGVGISTDSRYYLGAAHKALSLGWTQAVDPTGHFPPLYPWCLATMGAMTGELEQGARLLHVLCAGVLVFCLCRICLNAMPGGIPFKWSRVVLGLAVLTLIFADDFIRLFVYVLSEPLFMTMVMGSGLFLQRTQMKGGRLNWVCAGLLLGLATLVRHAGLFLLPPALIWVVLTVPGKLKERVLPASLFLGAAALPLLLHKLMFASTGSRSLAFHWPGPEHWHDFGQTVAAWFLPYRLAFPVVGWGLALVLVLAGCEIWRRWLCIAFSRERKPAGGAGESVMWATGSAIFYLGLVIVTVMLIDFDTPLDYRLLFPVHVLAMVCLSLGLANCYRLPGKWRSLVLIGLLLCFGGQLLKGVKTVQIFATQGIGIGGKAMRASTAIAYVRNLADTMHVVSNKPEVIQELLGRSCDLVPLRTDRMTMKPNEKLGDELKALASRKSLLVWFTETKRVYLPSVEEIGTYAELEKLPASDDKVILYVVRPAAQP